MRDIGNLKYNELTPAERKRVDAQIKRNSKVPVERVTVTGAPKSKTTKKTTAKKTAAKK